MPVDTNQVLNITSGANHTVVLLEMRRQSGKLETQLWGSGDESAGQLGAVDHRFIHSGEKSTIFRPIELSLEQDGLLGYQPKLVAASWEATYVTLSCDGRRDVLISMGSNDFGDLGVGMISEEKKTRLFHIVSFDHLALDGNSLNNASIKILSLVTGQRHVVVQLEVAWRSNSLRKCLVGWGTSRHSQLGKVIDQRGRSIPYISAPCIISVEDDEDPIVTTALGSQHTVLLRASGGILGFGSNRKNQLQGLGDVEHATKIGCTWNGTYALVEGENGTEHILATGSAAHGQLGRQIPSGVIPSVAPVELFMSKTTRIRALACGTEHVLALLFRSAENGNFSEVWGWGWNEHGNLGVGTTENAFTPIQLWPPLASGLEREKNHFSIGIWAGSGTSWILTSTGNTQ
ncbi:hypothetical protein H2248_001379 [Termitomyces sp. 'cryptogamus']|nr:hypothetical protein H2248_001379 [Termitomyces sp. 'cryptogamus']